MDHLTKLKVPTISDVIIVNPSSVVCTPLSLSASLAVDEGFSYGLSFFETILVLDRAIFCDAHVERLNTSLKTFGIPIHITVQLIEDIIRTYAVKHKAFKIQVSDNNVVISLRELSYTKDYYLEGASVSLSPIVRSSRSYLVGHKSGNYGDLILSLRNAHKKGFSDCLFLNEYNHLTETCIANLFIIKNNILYTPDLLDGLLPGTVRSYILSTYDVIEKSLTVTDLTTCDGAFLTNSIVGIVKVSRFETTPIPNHPLMKSIATDYMKHIGGLNDTKN